MEKWLANSSSKCQQLSSSSSSFLSPYLLTDAPFPKSLLIFEWFIDKIQPLGLQTQP